MSHNILVSSTRTLILAVAFWYGTLTASAQSTAFTYQGQLNDGGSPATGSYDLQFKLFDALTAGTQVGSTATLTNVTVTNGVFTVTLDFGASAFPGANRWLEISVRLAGSGTYTTLTPRQPLTSTPYAIKSLSAASADGLSAACTGCVTSAQIGSLPTGSGNYIQNTTALRSGNFNISGSGYIGSYFGIGTTDPETRLHLRGQEARLRLQALSANDYTVTEYQSDARFWITGVGGSTVFNDNKSKYFIYDATAVQHRMVIDTNGNVGLGTTKPEARLDTAGTIRSTAQTVPISGEGLEVIYYNGQGYLTSYNRTSSFYNPLNLEGSALSLNVGSGGNVGIGGIPTTTPGVRLQVAGDVRVGIGTTGCVKDANDDVIAGTCSSDLRFKQNITPFPNILHKLTRLQPVHFYWRTEAFPSRHFGSEQSYGLIAQEVEEVLPELVTKDGEGYRAVNYSKLPLMMLQAIKEMKAEQDTLKQQNAALQQQNATLQTRLATLERMMQRLAEQAEKPTPKQR